MTITHDQARDLAAYSRLSPEQLAKLPARAAAGDVEAEKMLFSVHAMQHENLHGFGPQIEAGMHRGAVEELTTELAARRLTSDMHGIASHTEVASNAYSEVIDPVVEALQKASGATREEAYRALEDAALKFKRRSGVIDADHAIHAVADDALVALKASGREAQQKVTQSIYKVSREVGPQATDLSRSAGARTAPDDLLAQLQGTAAKIGEGNTLGRISAASPARAEYVANKAETTAEAAAHFRGQAVARRAGMGDAAAPWNEGIPIGKGTAGYEASPMAAAEREAQAAAREHPLATKQLEMAHDDALERAHAATDPAIKREAIAEAKAIEKQLSRVGARPGAVEDIAVAAPVLARYEKSGAGLVEALGEAAPPVAKENAKAVRAAEDMADRKTMARTTRAIEDHAASVDTRPLRSAGSDLVDAPSAREQAVAGAQRRKLEADASYARARAAETEAKIGAKSTAQAAKDARTAAKAGAPESTAAPRKGAGIANKVMAAATVVEVASDVGIPGIPHPRDIPVIGPLLSTYLKYRAFKAAAGRFVGRVPATAETRAAALAAQTKDKIARAVDQSLGLVERSTPTVRALIVAGSLRINDALSKRAIDDGEPDAPKGANTSQLASVRMREVAAATTNPQIVIDLVRKQTVGISDPELIDALEKHLTAMFAHLNDTAPKGPPPNPFSKTPWLPSPAEALQWGRRLAVANDPTAALEALQSQTLTPEGADSFRTVYPKLAQVAQRRLAERAADLKNPVAYRQLVQNGLLFDQALHPSLEPENAAVLRTAHAPIAPTPPPGPPGPPPVPSVAGPTNVNNLYQTTADRRAAR